MSPKAKLEIIEEGKHRHDIAYKYSIILALDQESAGTMLIYFTQRLHELLSGCATCIRNWHMGRKAYLKELQEYVIRISKYGFTDLRPDDMMKTMQEDSAKIYFISILTE